MKIFSMDLESFELTLEPEVLKIKEFAALFSRDRSKGKLVAQSEMMYVWFFSDFKSDFLQIIDEDERSTEVKASIEGLPKNWLPDDLVKAAHEKYVALSSTVASRMLSDAREILNNMSRYAKEASKNLGDKDNDIGKIQSFVKDLPKIIDTLGKLEETVLREKDSSLTHRGSQEKAMFEDEEE